MSECSGRHTRSAKSVRNERGEAKGDGMLPESGGPYLHRSIVRALYIFLSVCVCRDCVDIISTLCMCVCVCKNECVHMYKECMCTESVCMCGG